MTSADYGEFTPITVGAGTPTALPGEAEVVDFIRKLRDFDNAYSEDFFTPLSEAEKAKVGGELRSRIAADMGRHLAKFFVQAADALQAMQARVVSAEEANKALMDERTSLIETKRQQIERLTQDRITAERDAQNMANQLVAAEARVKEMVEAFLRQWFGDSWPGAVPGDPAGVFDDASAALRAALSIRGE